MIYWKEFILMYAIEKKPDL